MRVLWVSSAVTCEALRPSGDQVSPDVQGPRTLDARQGHHSARLCVRSLGGKRKLPAAAPATAAQETREPPGDLGLSAGGWGTPWGPGLLSGPDPEDVSRASLTCSPGSAVPTLLLGRLHLPY